MVGATCIYKRSATLANLLTASCRAGTLGRRAANAETLLALRRYGQTGALNAPANHRCGDRCILPLRWTYRYDSSSLPLKRLTASISTSLNISRSYHKRLRTHDSMALLTVSAKGGAWLYDLAVAGPTSYMGRFHYLPQH